MPLLLFITILYFSIVYTHSKFVKAEKTQYFCYSETRFFWPDMTLKNKK